MWSKSTINVHYNFNHNCDVTPAFWYREFPRHLDNLKLNTTWNGINEGGFLKRQVVASCFVRLYFCWNLTAPTQETRHYIAESLASQQSVVMTRGKKLMTNSVTLQLWLLTAIGHVKHEGNKPVVTYDHSVRSRQKTQRDLQLIILTF